MGVGAAAGYAWDDNVGLDELECATGESDEVTSLEIQGSALFSFQDISMRISAGLVDDSYQNFSIDRRTESLGINLETQIGGVQRINWFDVSADLDSEAFLTYERPSPYLAGFHKRWFLRGEYVRRKTIARRPGREADSHSVSMDSYFFIQGRNATQ